MIPIKQTRFGRPVKGQPSIEPPGNCWSACVASILQMDLADVPDEMSVWKKGMTPEESWKPFERLMHEWLFVKGLVLIEVEPGNLIYTGPKEILNAYCIVSGPSPRGGCLHAVVGKLVIGGTELIHDPHPSNSFIVMKPDVWTTEVFVRHFVV